MLTSVPCGAAARPCPKVACAPSGSTRAGRQPLRLLAASDSHGSSSHVPQPRQESSSSGRRQLLAAAAVGALLSLQRPASAAEVPKAYQDTARKLVDALREAISTDLSDAEEREVRRAADPAKSLVREFLTRWKGNPAVAGEESYAQLTSAIQQLGAFYQANGQRTRLTPEAGQAVLDTLDAAEAALPAAQEVKSLLPFF
ncbi:hypothetical protein ABPG75_012946 [Micractinium tetrahymenae]